MRASTRHFWFGLLVMALGVLVLFNAVLASMAIVTVTGLFLLLAGGMQIFLGFSAEGLGTRLLTWLLGAATIFLGWSFMAHPLAGIISLSTMLLLLLAASGVAQMGLAFRARGTRFFWLLLVAGLLSLMLAIVLLSSPGATLTLLGGLMGLQMLSAGASLTIWGMLQRDVPG